tara:strand:- start:177 stop:1055 length:879 start_codon:yes stop_codon:yes gene_type:complete
MQNNLILLFFFLIPFLSISQTGNTKNTTFLRNTEKKQNTTLKRVPVIDNTATGFNLKDTSNKPKGVSGAQKTTTFLSENNKTFDKIPKEILKAAQDQLDDFLHRIPAGKETLYGFNNRNEFSIAEIGYLYEVITLNNNFFKITKLNSKQEYTKSTNSWRAMILVNNQARALLTLTKINNNWEIVKLGANNLAAELHHIMNNENFKNDKIDIYSDFKLFRVFQLKSDFLLTNEYLFPLNSAKRNIFLSNNNTSSNDPSIAISDRKNQKLKDLEKYKLFDLLEILKNHINKLDK